MGSAKPPAGCAGAGTVPAAGRGAPRGPTDEGPADASAEAPAADEDMPDAFDDTTMELLRKAATGTDAKRAMAAALRDLNMVKRVRRG